MLSNEHWKLKRDRKVSLKQTTIRLPVDLKEELQQEALKKGISFNEIITIALWKYLGKL